MQLVTCLPADLLLPSMCGAAFSIWNLIKGVKPERLNSREPSAAPSD